MYTDPDGEFPLPIITGLIGAAGGLIYGVATGKNWKQTLALTGGGFIAGATMGLAGPAVAALGGTEVISVAGAGYITIGTGVAGGLAGNAAEQGIRMALGDRDNFDQVEFAISGAFGIAEPALGPIGDVAQNSIKEGIKDAVFMPNRAQQRKAVREATSQIRGQLGPGRVKKRQARQAAKELVQAAVDNRSATLQGKITFHKRRVEVTMSALQTTGTEEVKTEVLKDEQ